MKHKFEQWILKQARSIMLKRKDKYCMGYYNKKCIGCPYHTDKYDCLPLDTWKQLLKLNW